MHTVYRIHHISFSKVPALSQHHMCDLEDMKVGYGFQCRVPYHEQTISNLMRMI